MIRTAQKVADLWGSPARRWTLRAPLAPGATAATESGRLAQEIVPIDAPTGRRGETVRVERDESIRADTSLDTRSRCRSVRPQDMAAGNSTPLNDGASAVVLAGAEQVEKLGLKLMIRLLGAATVAADPTIMGIAPAYAMPLAIERSSLGPEDIDVYQVHEAFSAQARAVRTEFASKTGFQIPEERGTPNDGAVTIGHPFGTTGARYLITLSYQFHLTGARYGRGSPRRQRAGRRAGGGTGSELGRGRAIAQPTVADYATKLCRTAV